MMWPWGHAAIGYLLYTAYTWRRYDHRKKPPTTLLFFGTQFPDLIDKPLVWTLVLLPSGRSLGHSLLVLVYTLATRYRNPEWGSAFAIGALSHAVVDVRVYDLVAVAVATRPPYDEHDRTILGHFLTIKLTPLVAIETMVVIWWRDGRSGANTMLRLLS